MDFRHFTLGKIYQKYLNMQILSYAFDLEEATKWLN